MIEPYCICCEPLKKRQYIVYSWKDHADAYSVFGYYHRHRYNRIWGGVLPFPSQTSPLNRSWRSQRRGRGHLSEREMSSSSKIRDAGASIPFLRSVRPTRSKLSAVICGSCRITATGESLQKRPQIFGLCRQYYRFFLMNMAMATTTTTTTATMITFVSISPFPSFPSTAPMIPTYCLCVAWILFVKY